MKENSMRKKKEIAKRIPPKAQPQTLCATAHFKTPSSWPPCAAHCCATALFPLPQDGEEQ